MAYSLVMATGSTDVAGLRARANQEETAPFPLEFQILSRRARPSQDETAPFPLEFQIVSPDGRVSQEETSPFLLEFMVIQPDGEAVLARVPCVQRAQVGALPRLKWRGIDASLQLRRYAARIASGEKLPPFGGPILVDGAFPGKPSRKAPRRARTSQTRNIVKFALGAIALVALAASLMLGDDAQLQSAGQSISRWFTGDNGAFQVFPTLEPANAPADRR